MTKVDNQKLSPQVHFLYEMVKSFFESARRSLDPVLQAIDGYRQLEVNQDGTPTAPEHVAQKFAELTNAEVATHLGACLTATTNLGLAYVHSFRLLGLMGQNNDVPLSATNSPNLVELFDVLPIETRKSLSDLFERVDTHDFEIEISTVSLPEKSNDEPKPNGPGLRATLEYWQQNHMLHDSHTIHLLDSPEKAMRIFIPFRSILVLDRILAEMVAPSLDQDYDRRYQHLSSNSADPVLEWDGEVIYVSLPDKLGRVLEARWNPNVTSVVRIREAGADSWSPGFETPFSNCSFINLKPNTEYDVQVTQKSQFGESEPMIESIETGNAE